MAQNSWIKNSFAGFDVQTSNKEADYLIKRNLVMVDLSIVKIPSYPSYPFGF